MKRYLLALTAFVFVLAGSVSAKDLSDLRFNKNGEFKIVQFTDTHYVPGNPKSYIAIERIHDVLNHEKPDLVVLTGDIIYSQPAEEGIRAVLGAISEHNVPFVITFGNHDHEFLLSNAQLYDIARTIPNNILPDRGEVESPDFSLPVKSADGKTAAVLYCFDSHGSLPGKQGYAPLKHEQVTQYMATSKAYTEANGGKPLPALAFMHVPLPEYKEACAKENSRLYGHRWEAVCSSNFNAGMFNAMYLCKDVMGVFVGHDHDNDYTVMHHGILLAYGRYTGGDTVYNHLPNGARVIVLKEGKRSFETWITLKDGERELKMVVN